MNHSTKTEAIRSVREEVALHPIFAKAVIGYLSHALQDTIDAMDAADNMMEVARQQGRRSIIADLVKILSGGTA